MTVSTDPNNCRSCLHLGNILRGIEFVNELVPLPGHAHDTHAHVSVLLAGHLETSHAEWIATGATK